MPIIDPIPLSEQRLIQKAIGNGSRKGSIQDRIQVQNPKNGVILNGILTTVSLWIKNKNEHRSKV